MLEAVQCPKCSARYQLRRERVKPVHARALCHKCSGVFPIHDVVARLLDLPPKEQPDDATATMGFKVEDLEQLHILPPALTELPEEPVFLEPEAELEPLPAHLPVAESLSADDLLGSDSEILEKTLVTNPEPVPEIRTSPNLPEPLPEERTAAGQEEALPNEGRTTGSYRSAKDAISQLFGETPISSSPRLRKESTNGAFEVEATLEALEHTLGGSESAAATPAPAPTPAPLSASEPEFAAPSSATQRMSLAEMQAAIAAVSMPSAPEPAPAPSAQELEASEVTQMMDASRLAKQDPGATNPVSPLMADIAPASDDPNLLRLKIGDEVYPNLGMEQLTRWVEEGRVIETHLVARQFSENWIEAHKVPGLRPVFERLKRLRAGGPEASPEATAPVKKSLFGGLFGKKEN